MPRKAERPARLPAAEQKIGRTDPPVFMFEALRTRALESLPDAGGGARKLIGIVAPVGYGKTVLMSMLLADLRRTGRQCRWFALDDRDTAIDSVLGELEPLLDGREARLHPTHALFRGHDPVETRIDALIELANRNPLPLTLFIDNLHCCDDPAFGRLLDALVFRTRASLQLVLSSARKLPLDVARASLEGLISPLGPADLGFGSGEVASLLGKTLSKRIGVHGVEDLTRQTEGWPAAVRMAQIILSNAANPEATLKSFSGSDEALGQLLNRQVLSGFPDALREFLLCLAQLRTFSLELCSHAIEGADVREHLSYLIERNIFVIPLDRNRSWYRLHGLFRDHLLHEAEHQLSARRRNEVLTRAARWCETHGYWRESIDYALASGSATTASQILEHIAPGFVRDRGDVLQYIRWLESLHEQGHQAGPEAEYWFVWALAFHRRYEVARIRSASLASRVQRVQNKRGASTKDDDLQRRIAILRTSIDSLTDHLDDAHHGAEQWLASADNSGATTDDPFNVTAAHCIRCGWFTSQFRFVDARRAIQSARESAFQSASAYVDGWVASYAALIGLGEGSYAATYAELASALATTRAALGEDAGICGTMALVAARCAAGMGLIEDARQLLDFGMKTSRTHGFLEAAAAGLEAAVLLWTGDRDDHAALVSSREVAGAYPPRLAFMLSSALARRLARLGRIDEARAEAARIGIDVDVSGRRPRKTGTPVVPTVEAAISAVKIELLIAAGRYPQATTLIADEQRRAKASDGIGRLVELALDAATIAARSGATAVAVRQITRAVSLAATRRIVRPFDDHGEILAAVVAEARPSVWGFASDEERRFFAERCRCLPAGNPPAESRIVVMQEEPRLLGRPTTRELELLGYIDAGLSNQQLADRTDTSLTTIKWHLQNLYGKLGVSSRSAALARARGLNLLAR